MKIIIASSKETRMLKGDSRQKPEKETGCNLGM